MRCIKLRRLVHCIPIVEVLKLIKFAWFLLFTSSIGNSQCEQQKPLIFFDSNRKIVRNFITKAPGSITLIIVIRATSLLLFYTREHYYRYLAVLTPIMNSSFFKCSTSKDMFYFSICFLTKLLLKCAECLTRQKLYLHIYIALNSCWFYGDGFNRVEIY